MLFRSRDAATYARGHLDNAQPASDEAMRQLMKSRRRDRPILVYCYHGNSSRNLCQFIAGFGYSRVYNLVGGWKAWEQFSRRSHSHSAPVRSGMGPAPSASGSDALTGPGTAPVSSANMNHLTFTHSQAAA